MTNPIAVGIDLGTTNSVVAVAQGGQPRVLTTPDGAGLIPSVVSFAPNGQTLVGAPARLARTQDPEHTVFSVKRLMGRPFDSEEVRRAAARFAFQLERGPDQSVLVRTRAGTHTLPELSALVLREVRRVAEGALGQPIGRAVITVPANFNELQRSATKLAGQIADIDVARILNEPTAAALAYGYGRGTRERIAVFDFGGGTFDVTLLELSGNVFEVLATAGDTFLGGDDIDLALAEGLADGASKALRFDARKDRRAYEMLRAAAEQAKIDLSTLESVQVKVSNIAQGPGGRALEFRSRIARSEFEKVAQPFVQRTIDVSAEALKLAGLKPSDFAAVILVGGSSQIPLVRRAVRDFFRSEPHTSLPPDTVVAMGAAVLAEALGGKRTKITGQNRVSKSPSGAPPSPSQAPPTTPSQAPMSAAGAPIPPPPPAPSLPSVSDAAMPAVRPGGAPLAPPAPPTAPSTVDLPAVAKPGSHSALPAVRGGGRAPIRRGGDPAAPPPPAPMPVGQQDAGGSVTGLPAIKGPSPIAAAPPLPPPPPPIAFSQDAQSVSDLPAVRADGVGLPMLPKGAPVPSSVSTGGLPAVRIEATDSMIAMPAVSPAANSPAVRPRTTTEPHGVARPSSSSDHALPAVKPEPSPPSSAAGLPAPRMRTRTITHASAAVPPPAPLSAPGAPPPPPSVGFPPPVPPGPPGSSIVPPKPGDLLWNSGQSQPSISVRPESLVPLDDDYEPNLPTAIRSAPPISGGPALDDAFGDEPTSMHSAALLAQVQAPKTVTDIGASVDLPALSTKVESKIPTLTSVDPSNIPARAQPQGSNIPTQPTISPSILGNVRPPHEDAPGEGVTTLKRYSQLIDDAEPSPPKPPASIQGNPPTPPLPPAYAPPTPAAAVNPPSAQGNPNIVGRRTAVIAAAPPPPPPPMAPVVPPMPPLSTAASNAPALPPAMPMPEPSFGDPSLLTSMKGLSDADLGFDAPLPPPPSPAYAPPAVATAPFAGATQQAPSPKGPAAAAYGGPAANPYSQTAQAPWGQQPPPSQLVTPPPPTASGASSRMQAPLLLDVTPQSLRVETVGGLSQLVIARNSTIPLEQTREFATAYDNQQDVRIRIAQGEQARFGENQPLGELELSGLRPAPRGDVKIAVTFELDADGTLRVRALDMLTGLQTTAKINLLTMPGAAQATAMAARQRGN
ncbi:MAG: Hsp70 family protein [Myxococcales bacterium]|nr:Hsp70 family protein [Myxococcales bacterium]